MFLLLAACAGDASHPGVDRPSAGDTLVPQTGTPRHQVIAAFGKPVLSEVQQNVKVDLFRFVGGNIKAAPPARSFIFGSANAAASGGKEVRLRITYDKDDRVAIIERFQ